MSPDDPDGFIPDGSIDKPFGDLFDAINKAEELAAPYYNSDIFIYLFAGDHYLLRTKKDYYIPLATDSGLY